ncbi:MAG: O-antigen ligase family protein [Candidatus Hydrogenedentes bacterium]|nr:O-antigen ligase family protein [Candidatus Hydrogenedentota bacterium]
MSKTETRIDSLFLTFPPIEELIIAAAIGLILFFRPFIDGITHPEYNVPFTWAAAAIAAFWCVMVLLGRMQVRFLSPVSLLAVFLFIAVATAPFTIQYSTTYRGLIIWSGYLLLFCVAANALRSRLSIGIVLGAFIVASMAEAIWAVLQVMYAMPATRAQLMRNPEMANIFFGDAAGTDAMRARLESNRAYGTFLFANALACWLLVGIPIAIACANGLYLRLSTVMAEVRRDPKLVMSPSQRSFALYATVAVGIALFVGITTYYLIYFALAYQENANIGDHWVRWIFYCTIVPLALTIAAGVFASRYGARAMLLAFASSVSGLFGIIAVYGLGATYSRGGMIACAGALLVMVALMSGYLRFLLPKSAANAVTGLLIFVAVFTSIQVSLAQPPTATREVKPTPTYENLSLEGHNPSMDAMLDPNTALLRLGYWISGVHMFADNPITGVGLGNFGIAYPHYQILGAGDVKPAHNDYLQAACETGLFGLVAFLVFWAYFIVRNGRSILQEGDRATRWFRAGIFASVIGFLMHSFVDFNFFNPSLATLAFVLGGITYAWLPDVTSVTAPRSRTIALGMLALVVWTLYAGLRVSRVDAALEQDATRRARLAIADMMLERDPGSHDKAFGAYESTMAMFIEDPSVRDSIGKVLIQTGKDAYRYPKQGEVLPPTARRIIQPAQFPAMRKAALDAVKVWIDRCIATDSRFPYDPDLSGHIVQWYDRLRAYSPDPAERLRASDECIRWAQACVDRSPTQFNHYHTLAQTLWSRGEMETSVKQLEYYDAAVAQLKHRAALYPVKPIVWREYAEKCQAYGEALKKAGDAVRGQELVDTANQASKKAGDLEAQIQKIALGRG